MKKQRKSGFMILTRGKIIALLVIMFPIARTAGGLLDYYDEFIGLLSICTIIALLIKKKLDKQNRQILLCLTVITLIVILSNLYTHYTVSFFAVIVDILWLWKPFATFIAFQYFFKSEYQQRETVHNLLPFAKFVVIFVFSLSIIGQFVNIGVTGTHSILGFKSFYFFWHNGIQTGWLIFGALMIIGASGIKKRKFVNYLIIGSVPLVLTTSANVMAWVFFAFALFIMLNEKRLFKWYYFLILGIGVVAFTFADVSKYLLSDSVRMKFIKTAISLAKNYFPFGTGFALFGSDMAARYYSPVYRALGWTSSWTLGINGTLLNDNYFAMILGQFGIISFIIFGIMLYLIFKSSNTNSLNRFERITVLASIITIIISMIGSASSKTCMGVYVYAVMGIIVSKNNFSNARMIDRKTN